MGETRVGTIAADWTRHLPALTASILCVTGFLPFLIQPGMVEGLVTFRRLDAAGAGVVVGVEMVGLLIGSVAPPFLLTQRSWRTVALCALVLAAAGDALSMADLSLPALIAARGVAGTGEGALIAAAYAILASGPRPGLALGLNAAFMTAVGAAAGAFLPAAYAHIGFMAVPVILLASLSVAALAALAIPALPIGGASRVGEPRTAGSATDRALVGCAIMFLGQGASWAYLFLLGTRAGLPAASVGQVLSAGLVASSLGGLVLAALSTRCSLHALAALGSVGAALSLLPLWHQPTFALFAGACIFYTFSTGFLTPLAILVVGRADPTGQGAAYGGAAQLLGLAIGPIVGGWVMDRAGVPALLLLSMLLMGLYWPLVAFAAPRRPSAPDGRMPSGADVASCATYPPAQAIEVGRQAMSHPGKAKTSRL